MEYYAGGALPFACLKFRVGIIIAFLFSATLVADPQFTFDSTKSSIIPEFVDAYCPNALRKVVEHAYLGTSIVFGRGISTSNLETKRAFKKMMNGEPLNREEKEAVRDNRLNNSFYLLENLPKWIQTYNYGIGYWIGSRPKAPQVNPFLHLSRFVSAPLGYYFSRGKRETERIYAKLLSEPKSFFLSEQDEKHLKSYKLLDDFNLLRSSLLGYESLHRFEGNESAKEEVKERAEEDLANLRLQLVDTPVTVPISITSWISPITNPVLVFKSRRIYGRQLKSILKEGKTLPAIELAGTKKKPTLFGDYRFLRKYGLLEDYERYGKEAIANPALYKKLWFWHEVASYMKWGVIVGVAGIASTTGHSISSDASFNPNAEDGMKEGDDVELIMLSRGDRVALRIGNRVFEFDGFGKVIEYKLSEYRDLIKKKYEVIPTHNRIQFYTSPEERSRLVEYLTGSNRSQSMIDVPYLKGDSSLGEANQALRVISGNNSLRFVDHSRVLTSAAYRLREFFGSKRVKRVIHAKPSNAGIQDDASEGAESVALLMLTNGKAALVYSPLADRVVEFGKDMNSLFRKITGLGEGSSTEDPSAATP